jgi:hypothetical protein
MDPILTVTATDTKNMLAYIGQLYTDVNLLIVLAIGLPVGFWVINKVISLVTRHAK